MKHKTKKGIAKRFRRTKRGKIAYMKAGRGHLLGQKSRKRKRSLRAGGYVSAADYDRIAGYLPK